MSGVLSAAELAGIQADTDLILGIDANGVDAGRTQVTVRRITSRGTIDATSGRYLNPTYLTLYSGAAIIFPIVYRRERQELVAEQAERVRMYRVLLPADSPASGEFRENDIVTVTASDDTNFTGAVMRVTDVMYESDHGIRRLSAVVWEDAGKATFA
jgi:hypothetical protein